jgi:hypothetical protein
MAVGVATIRNLGGYAFHGRTLIRGLLVLVVRGLDAVMSAGPTERDEDESKGHSGAPAAGASSIILFALGNFLVFTCLLISTPVFGSYTLLLIVAALLLHFLCFLSVLLVIKEETDVWDGLLTEKDRVFTGGKNIKNPSVLILSTVFFILFISVFAQQWDQTARSTFIVTLPNIGCAVGVCRNIQYLLAIIYEIPVIGWALRAIAPGGAAEFSPGPGPWLKFGIDFLTATYIFGVFKYVYFQRKAVNDLITAFEKSGGSSNAGFLVQRAERAPEYILDKMFERALGKSEDKIRLAYVKALFEARIYKFAYVFVGKLDQEKNPENRRQGLDELIKLIKLDGRRFTREVTAETFNALNKQMKINHLEISVQEKLNEASLALVELGWQVKSLSKKKIVRLLSLVKERATAEMRLRLRDLLSRMSLAKA